MTDQIAPEATKVRFTPGTAVAFVGANVAGLIADDSRSDLVKQVWSASQDDASLDDLLELLAATGVRTLPSIGLVEITGSDVRVLVRGEVAALFEPMYTGRVIAVQGDRVHSWVEHAESDVGGVHLHLADDLTELGPFETTGGLFPASRIGVVFTAVDYPIVSPVVTSLGAAPPQPAVEVNKPPTPLTWSFPVPPGPASPSGPTPPPLVSIPVPAPDVSTPAEVLDSSGVDPSETPGAPDDTADVEPITDESPDDLAAEPAPTDDLDDSADQAADPAGEDDVDRNTLVSPFDDLAAGDDGDVLQGDESSVLGQAPAAQIVPAVSSMSPGAVAIDDEPAAVGVAADQNAQQDPAQVDDYDALFGATQFRTVEDAAVRADEASATGTEPPQLIESAPGPDGQSSVPIDGDHDGMTITLADLLAQAEAEGGSPSSPPVGAGSPGSPMVHAVSCPAGHLNPPHASTCRVCRVGVDEQVQVTVPRPVLGVLRFTDGTVVNLSRPLILGRSPKADGQVSGELPELIPVSSPLKEVSGTHMELRLEDWKILAVDRQSTNGTTIRLPGREPQRLHPGEPFPITIGTTVNLADEVEFVLEAGP